MGGSSQRGEPGRDVPANASALDTAEAISLERQREDLRMDQQKRKYFSLLCVGVVTILILAAAVSAATAVVGLVNGPDFIIVPALSVLGGAGTLGVLAWRIYLGTLPPRA